MSRSRARAALVAVVSILVVVGVSGCAAGFDASTSQPYAPSNGSVASIGDLRVRDVVIVTSPGGAAPELYAYLVSIGGGPDGYGTVEGQTVAPLPDSLTGITVSGASTVVVPGAPIPIPPGGTVNLGPSGTRIFLDNFTVKQGDLAEVTFSFARAGTATVSALVMSEAELVGGG